MRVLYTSGNEELARVFVAELEDGNKIEFVESVQPPVPRDEKWVLIVSTLKGCPVGCPICDAGTSYHGRLSANEIVAQVDHLIRRRFPDGIVPVPKLKVHFARMGEPSLNHAVLDALVELSRRPELPGFMPSISTVAPSHRQLFFDDLLQIKQEHFTDGNFQLQFSVHTTDSESRQKLVPIKTWSLKQIAEYGNRFFAKGDRKVTLNFAAAKGLPLEPEMLAPLFSPDRFLIKLTPINPTGAALRSGLESLIKPGDNESCQQIVKSFKAFGYDTILSIGELEENEIGSNCGMYVSSVPKSDRKVRCA